MALRRVVVEILCLTLVDAIMLEHVSSFNASDTYKSDTITTEESDLNSAFNGVYTECLMHLSYTCLQKKTLQYLKELDGLSEISIIGDYVKFVKFNTSEDKGRNKETEESSMKTSEELSNMIDKAVDNFFNHHLIRFSALGKDVVVPHTVEEFVGRKRRKGGGGGGHGGGDGDGGKKKMMMMAMMCMKMKLMMMIPAMMGMMGMMSFKGMMFSMMSFMISKMMLLMKLLEKKGGGGGGGGGGGDGSWAASGGGGAWMPAGGQDYGGGGGYDSNAQWSSRSILEKEDKSKFNEKPVITYIKPIVTYNNPTDIKLFSPFKKINDEVIKANNKLEESKSRKKRRLTDVEPEANLKYIINNSNINGITTLSNKYLDDKRNKAYENEPKRKKRGLVDALQNAYIYWTNKVLGLNGFKQKRASHPKYKIVNGVKYMYYPIRVQKVKTPKGLPVNNIKTTDDTAPIVITDFNKGEIVEERRMNRRNMEKMKENVNETVDENPWE